MKEIRIAAYKILCNKYNEKTAQEKIQKMTFPQMKMVINRKVKRMMKETGINSPAYFWNELTKI